VYSNTRLLHKIKSTRAETSSTRTALLTGSEKYLIDVVVVVTCKFYLSVNWYKVLALLCAVVGVMSLVADYGSSDDNSVDAASAEDDDRNEESTARSMFIFLSL